MRPRDPAAVESASRRRRGARSKGSRSGFGTQNVTYAHYVSDGPSSELSCVVPALGGQRCSRGNKMAKPMPAKRSRPHCFCISDFWTAARAMAAALRSVLAIGLLAGLGGAAPPTTCQVGEFACATGRCVPSNRFCDTRNDCGDSSDEPRHCTRK
ncbi:hypothetical protein HUJ04_000049 [Dendroctonus ponderosae]|nr:hypothetical protein HUJ04_000049 [Dendroctonus ponderosae]